MSSHFPHDCHYLSRKAFVVIESLKYLHRFQQLEVKLSCIYLPRPIISRAQAPIERLGVITVFAVTFPQPTFLVFCNLMNVVPKERAVTADIRQTKNCSQDKSSECDDKFEPHGLHKFCKLNGNGVQQIMHDMNMIGLAM